jgi:hypothetical protein
MSFKDFFHKTFEALLKKSTFFHITQPFLLHCKHSRSVHNPSATSTFKQIPPPSSIMNLDKSQDEGFGRSGDASLEQALFRNAQSQNQNGSLPTISPFLLHRRQPLSIEKIRETLQAALDLTSCDDLDLDFELDEEFEALERSLRG